MIDKYGLTLDFIFKSDFGGDLTGVKTQDAYDRYLFYCDGTGIVNVEDKQIVIRDICSKYGYKSKQIMKAGNRFYIFEKRVTE